MCVCVCVNVCVFVCVYVTLVSGLLCIFLLYDTHPYFYGLAHIHRQSCALAILGLHCLLLANFKQAQIILQVHYLGICSFSLSFLRERARLDWPDATAAYASSSPSSSSSSSSSSRASSMESRLGLCRTLLLLRTAGSACAAGYF